MILYVRTFLLSGTTDFFLLDYIIRNRIKYSSLINKIVSVLFILICQKANVQITNQSSFKTNYDKMCYIYVWVVSIFIDEEEKPN